jgi:divalent metal cation (Fe/Co/Zn/Cd) transporter
MTLKFVLSAGKRMVAVSLGSEEKRCQHSRLPLSERRHSIYFLRPFQTHMHTVLVAVLRSTCSPATRHRITVIQTLTLVWMSVEVVVSLAAAWMAHSPALLGFGGDSVVELLSAAVVLWRFHSPSRSDHAEQRTARITGGLLFVLAAFVALASTLTLMGHVIAQPSPIGILLLILAAVVMPWLAKQKRELSVTTSSAALRADAAESAVCGYLALIALAGLGITAIWRVSWADPIAALALLPLILWEGWEAIKGKPCCGTGVEDFSQSR